MSCGLCTDAEEVAAAEADDWDRAAEGACAGTEDDTVDSDEACASDDEDAADETGAAEIAGGAGRSCALVAAAVADDDDVDDDTEGIAGGAETGSAALAADDPEADKDVEELSDNDDDMGAGCVEGAGGLFTETMAVNPCCEEGKVILTAGVKSERSNAGGGRKAASGDDEGANNTGNGRGFSGLTHSIGRIGAGAG